MDGIWAQGWAEIKEQGEKNVFQTEGTTCLRTNIHVGNI